MGLSIYAGRMLSPGEPLIPASILNSLLKPEKPLDLCKATIRTNQVRWVRLKSLRMEMKWMYGWNRKSR